MSPAKRRTSSRAPVAAFPGISTAGDGNGGGGGGSVAGAAAAEGQRTADEASLLLGDAGACGFCARLAKNFSAAQMTGTC